MRQWRTTAGLRRGVVVTAVVLVVAVVAGAPSLVLLVTPIALVSVLGLRHVPRGDPRPRAELTHQLLHEGQSTTSTVVLADVEHVEQVTRQVGAAPYLALSPSSGAVAALLASAGPPPVTLSPRRWGSYLSTDERVALLSRWGGFRWGPAPLAGPRLLALPQRAPFDSRAEAPHPVGLVGVHRSSRVGSGMELAGIRPYAAGDRMRRISWPVSLRRQRLHVIEGLAESDAGVLLIVDALADLGASEGIGGRASSLDLTVRAAAALAEHHIRAGDRVSVRVIGGSGQSLGFGSGSRHLRVLLGLLANVRPGPAPQGLGETDDPGPAGEPGGLRLRVADGTQVIVLSPLLSPLVATTAAGLAARNVPVVAIDTLPEQPSSLAELAPDARILQLAWRLRTAERVLLRELLTRRGCPVVAWRGPGTLDEVLRRLGRRARLPQVRAR